MHAIIVSNDIHEGIPVFADQDIPMPAPGEHDLLVKIDAISVNPVDTKQRQVPINQGETKILGYDAVGHVAAVGQNVQHFSPGDKVFYAGDVTRPGTNAEYHLVDARIVAKAPTSLEAASAAALPLVSLTAYELLFDRIGADIHNGGQGRTLLIIAGAGGVGSMAIQLGKLAGFKVVATASRAASRAWCLKLGADHVIDHHQALAPQLEALGIPAIDIALNFANTTQYWDVLGELLAPQGHVGLIVEPDTPLAMGQAYKSKCIGIHWEFMFARARFKTADMSRQGQILANIARLVDESKIKPIMQQTLSPINAANLDQAHQWVRSGKSIGKTTLAGFDQAD